VRYHNYLQATVNPPFVYLDPRAYDLNPLSKQRSAKTEQQTTLVAGFNFEDHQVAIRVLEKTDNGSGCGRIAGACGWGAA
jgi:hypothetical protein